MTAIANGYGVALAPESSARFYARPGIIYRPVSGVSPSQVGVAWAPADDATPLSKTSSAAAWTTLPPNPTRRPPDVRRVATRISVSGFSATAPAAPLARHMVGYAVGLRA